MLPKSHRLSHKDIISLRKTAKRFQTDYFSVLHSTNSLKHLRLSTEISLKIDKRSSHRNQIRRYLFLILERSSLITKSLDVLIVAKPKIGQLLPRSVAFKEAANLITDTLLR